MKIQGLLTIVMVLLWFTYSGGEELSQLEEGKDIDIKNIVIVEGASCITEKCHSDIPKKKYKHMIGSDGMKCSICHVMTEKKRHVFQKISDVTAPLCKKCHSRDVMPPSGLKKAPPKIMDLKGMKDFHKPFKEGKCTICHDAHGSDYPWHLKAGYPGGTYASYSEQTYALCVECHKETNKMLEQPRTLSLTMFRNGNVNLHYRHVNKKKGRTCTICHDSHATEGPALVKSTFKFGNRVLEINFEKTEEGGKCEATCHRVAKYNRYKPERNFMRTSPLPGKQATEEELEQSRIEDLKRLKEKQSKKKVEKEEE